MTTQSPENVPSVLTDEDINRAYVKSGVVADLKFWAKYKFPLARAIEQAVLAKYAAPATVGQHVQEGWKLVPIEPMHEMVSAMSTSQARDDEGEFPMLTDLIDFSGENKTHTAIRAAYAAMLAASPTPPAVEGQEPVADASIKAVYVQNFGSESGWENCAGSYFIEGYKAGAQRDKEPK